MSLTSWLIGSYPSLPQQTIDVSDGVTTETKTVASGSYYMFHSTGSLSLAQKVADAVNLHSGIADCVAEVVKSGKVRLRRTGGGTLGITWTTTEVRDVLGFTGNLSGASSYVAAKSKWFWSPGKQVSSDVAPAGVHGVKVRESVVLTAGAGKMEVVVRNTYRTNRLWWKYVPIARVWTQSEGAGEFQAFHDTVVARGRQFHVWRAVDEDTSDDSTTVSLGASLGPYKATREVERWTFERGIPMLDRFGNVTIEVVQVPEFT